MWGLEVCGLLKGRQSVGGVGEFIEKPWHVERTDKSKFAGLSERHELSNISGSVTGQRIIQKGKK